MDARMTGIAGRMVGTLTGAGVLQLLLGAVLVTTPARAQTVLTETTWGGPSSESTRAVAVSGTSTYLVGGTRSFGSPDATQVFALKFGADGSLTWQRTWDGPDPFFSDNATGAAAGPDGSLYVAGTTLGIGGDGLLLKFDGHGSLLWQRTWGTPTGDFGQSVAVAPDGSVYFVGATRSSDPDALDMFMVKFAPDGSLVWQKTWGTTGASEEGQGVAVGPDGSVYVVGYTPRLDGSFASDIAVLKLDPAGNLVWQRTYAAGDGIDSRGGVAVGPDGSVYVAGGIFDPRTFDLNVALIKLASDGTLVWEREWGGKDGDSVADVSVGPDGTVLFSGQSASLGLGSDDAFVVRLEPDGRILHASSWGSTGLDVGAGVEMVSATTISLGGTTETAPPYVLARAPSKTSRLRRTVLTATTIPLLDATGTIADAGGTVAEPNGSTTYAGDFDAVLVRIDVPASGSFIADTESAIGTSPATTAITPVTTGNTLVVPRSSSSARIHFSMPAEFNGEASATVVDVLGRRVRAIDATRAAGGIVDLEWDLKDEAGRRVSSGLYFVRLGAAGQPGNARIVVID